MTLLDQIRENWALIVLASNILFGAVMWRFSRVFATVESVADIAKDQEAMAVTLEEMRSEQRVLGERLANLPSQRDLAELRSTTSALGEAVPRLDESIKALGRQVHLLTENELNGARK